MNNFVSGVLVNLVSTVLFWLIGGLLLWAIVSNRQRRLHVFFGINRPPQIYVYLSSLPVPAGTLKSYYGYVNEDELIAVGVGEFNLIPLISGLLARRNFVVAETFSGLIDGIFSVTRPRIDFRCAPTENLERNIPSSATICIGSSHYNAVTRYYLENCNPPATFVLENGKLAIEIKRGTSRLKSGERLTVESGEDRAMLSRLHSLDENTNVSNIILIAAGTSLNGTIAATHYLLTNWSDLSKNYRDKDFTILFQGKDFESDPDGHKKFIVTDRIVN